MELLALQVDELLGSLPGATKAAAEQQWLLRLENLKEELLARQASKLRPKQRWRATVGYCALVGAVVAQWPESWQRSPDFLLDDAVSSALSPSDVDSTYVSSSSSRVPPSETPALRAVAQLLTKSQDCDVAFKAVIRFGVVVAANQLIQRQKPAQAEALLSAMVAFCEQRPQLRRRAKWALFLLAMAHWIHHQDVEQALRCFRRAMSDQKETNEDGDVDADDEEAGHGVFLYWYALALFQNGSRHEALAALNKCLRYEYEPVSIMTLSAWAHLKAKDLHEAANALQRAMEIDFAQSTSMFNHSLLLGRMNQFDAQQQMLQYYVQATTLAEQDKQGRAANKKRKLSSGSKEGLTSKSCATRSLFSGSDIAALFPVKCYDVSPDMVHLQLASAAMENGEWRLAKREFEAFFAAQHTQSNEAARDYIYVLLQCDLPSLVMDSCNQLLAQENVPDDIQVYAHMYKADALLCLERVGECQAYLKSTVEPMMDVLMKAKKAKDRSSSMDEELSQIYVELLNNLAVATACCNGVDAAITILRRGIQRCSSSLFLKFNLVLLMWRCDQKPSACAIWMEARGWNLDVDCETLADDQQALAFVAAKEEAALRSSSSDGESVLSKHVCAGKQEQGVSYQQLLFLDALVVNYWGKIRNLHAIQSSVNYVNYLGSIGSSKTPATSERQ